MGNRHSLSLSSKYFRNLIPTFQGNGIAVPHFLDVVKPIIMCLHSLCFEIPESYDLEYIYRLLKAINFFLPLNKNDIMVRIQHALCRKLADVSYFYVGSD